MKKINKDYYSKLGVSSKESNLVNEELALPVGLKLSPSARPRRVEMLQEAISWPRGKNQDNRKITKLYKSGDFEVAVGKPGKEAAPDFKRKHYITGETTNNPNDMNPSVFKAGKRIEDNLTFSDMFERIEHLMRADVFGLEILGMLIFRMAFVLDHQKSKEGGWRYVPPRNSLAALKKRIPKINNVPTEVFLCFLDVLALNEDVKMHTLGHENAQQDYGRVNTLLTFVHLIAVLLERRSLAKFAGAFARPPSGMAPFQKTERGGVFEVFPLLSPDFLKT
ncbi:MAG: hypothetical protein UT24_C0042G0006 [Candidatus Woesebacteria bacterium GW2011_GWB1_39_12]|uniref:Uncharacterized protein n=2 Tax=Patescibacteria group TaxID=1783273 RepID=A0A1F8DKI2_9BACT|nr:MAG: hypothetical protein UT24_C0042G0006 [Candidatus Woesebacteria bacterium GW2011_GWB1_39_12]OGM89121.1 MAG: hypothetical protein A2108_01985 [Candidatus Wolfebacteria bacterium GWA1_42_9]